MVKTLFASLGDAGDAGSIPGSVRSPGVGNGNPLKYSYLVNSMDREAWQATAHAVTESQFPGIKEISSRVFRVRILWCVNP